MNGSDAAATHGLGFIGHLVMDIAAAEHGLVLLGPRTKLEAACDSALAVPDNLGVCSAHSKCPGWLTWLIFTNPLSPNVHGHFELSFQISLLNHAWIKASLIQSAVKPAPI